LRNISLKKAGLGVLVSLLAIQAVPVLTDNPAVVPSQTIYAVQPMPARVQSILEASCGNCHSDRTNWPWYSRVAPVSWVVAHDVHQGRRQMNLSRWGSYPRQKQEQKLEEICEQIVNGDMPDGKYLLVHRRARLTQEQKDAVCGWIETAR
jgi:hypothetical protein